MDEYIRARPDIFFTGPDHCLASNRIVWRVAGAASTPKVGADDITDIRAYEFS